MSAGLLDALALLGLFLLGYLFWQWRLQEEQARRHAEQVCEKNNVQFLDIARSSGRLALKPKLGWQASFTFGFSSDSKSRYEGEIVLINLYLKQALLPPFRFHADVDNDIVDVEPSTATSEPSTPPAPQPKSTTSNYNVSYGDTAARVKQRSSAHQVPAPTHTTHRHDELDDVVDAIFPDDFPLQ
ncbi:MAG: DUF3301 domain-containing protein [Gammaproteobacteria bacterium]|nr:DUF3301 domain-containing protein [Gammaproteobacteria bacterium]